MGRTIAPVTKGCIFSQRLKVMPYFRNFTYWIDKRRWKYYFLMVSLEMDRPF
ncbi:MAG: hypothetical protein ACTHMC_21770 [Pseudobacter sp.]|uniref:hypothetical protein n=1 Tax=Pseudobacter sp. TaxID=2045420 RepID=UPI003F816B47